MSQAFLPFSRPSSGDEEIAAVEQVLRSPVHPYTRTLVQAAA